MKPQLQKYTRNNAEQNEFGDCHRTCIAMILNMSRDHVPHFMHGVDPATPADDPVWQRCEQEELAWLRKRGLTTVHVPLPGETELKTVLEQYKVLGCGAPFILGCTSSNGCNHSVVVHDGQVFNPNDGHIRGPMQDGIWWLTIYSVGPNWRSPRWQDRLLELFR
jgi:hypothetical protein